MFSLHFPVRTNMNLMFSLKKVNKQTKLCHFAQFVLWLWQIFTWWFQKWATPWSVTAYQVTNLKVAFCGLQFKFGSPLTKCVRFIASSVELQTTHIYIQILVLSFPFCSLFCFFPSVSRNHISYLNFSLSRIVKRMLQNCISRR